MVAFSRALWSGRLLPLERVRAFTRGVTQMGGRVGGVGLPLRYGLGFGELTLDDTRIVGHNGGAPGVNAEFDMYPDRDAAVVVLSNDDPPAATRVMMKIRQIVTGVTLPRRRPPHP